MDNADVAYQPSRVWVMVTWRRRRITVAKKNLCKKKESGGREVVRLRSGSVVKRRGSTSRD